MVYSPRIGPDGKFARDFLDVRKRIESLETREFGTYVRTDPLTGAETVIGELADGSIGVDQFVGDIIPPPVATTPIVSAQPGVITVSWDGGFVAAAEKPRDFQHVNVVGYKIVDDADVMRSTLGVIRLPSEAVLVTTDAIDLGETWKFVLESEDYVGNLAMEGSRSDLITMQSAISDAGINAALEELADADLLLQQASQDAQDAAQAAQDKVDAIMASGVNLTTNGDFDLPIVDPVTGWPETVLTTVEATASARSGANALRAYPSASAASAFTDYVDSAKDRVYSLEMWVRLSATAPTPSGDIQFNINTLKLDGTPDTIVLQPNDEEFTAADLSTATYTKITAKYLVPADSTKIRFGPHLTGNGNVYFVDNFKAIDVTAAEVAHALAQQAFSLAETAAETAGDAFDSADGKNTIWYMEDEPAGILHKANDAWFETDNDNRLSRWDETLHQWIPSLFGNSAIYGNIDAGKISAGYISTTILKAKSIGVDKLVISSTNNLVVEADFSQEGASWDLNANKTILPTGGRSGGPAFRFSGTTASNASFNLANKVAVDSDSRFRVSIWVKTNSVLAASSIRLGVRPYFGPTAQSTVVLLANSVTVSASNYVPGTDVWTQMQGVSSALPANTTHVEFYLATTLPTTATYVDVDSVSVTRAADGKLVVDGAIDGKVITGASFQTVAAAGVGIKIDDLGIRAFGPLSTVDPTFRLDSITGDLTATGIFQTALSGKRVKIWDHAVGSIAAIDMYPDGTEQHGALFSEKIASVYYTRLLHFLVDGGTAPNVTLTSVGSAYLQNAAGTAQISAAATGSASVVGTMAYMQNTTGSASIATFENGSTSVVGSVLEMKGQVRGGQAATDWIAFGQSTRRQEAQHTFTITYGTPAPYGNRYPVVTADAASQVTFVTQNCTATDFKIAFSSVANSNIAFRYMSYWSA